MAAPITDNKSVETHLLFEHIGQQVLMAVQLLALPATERCHDRLHARVQRPEIALGVNIAQLPLADFGIGAGDTTVGATSGNPMCSGGQHAPAAKPVIPNRALQTFPHWFAV